VTGLPDSSKGRDEHFLVITGNWQNPFLSCPLIPGVPGFCRFIKLSSFFFFFFFCPNCLLLSSSFSDKDFTAKDMAFVERKTVEHLLKRPCFIDSAGRPRLAPILLDYVPTYKSFQKGPVVKDCRQIEVTVSWPGKDQRGYNPGGPFDKEQRSSNPSSSDSPL
jgi:hypothetical protein